VAPSRCRLVAGVRRSLVGGGCHHAAALVLHGFARADFVIIVAVCPLADAASVTQTPVSAVGTGGARWSQHVESAAAQPRVVRHRVARAAQTATTAFAEWKAA
jgi:hypothetical protein